MRIRSLLSALLFMNAAAYAQTTVSFKPGPVQGDHALLITTYGCVPNGSTTPAEMHINNNAPDMHYADWSYSALGCARGTQRQLIRFAGLNTIPANAIILNATLNLFGVPSSLHAPNSTYPNSPYSTTNEGWLMRVTGNWSKSSVTWNTQPTTTTANRVSIPKSTSEWNWDTSLNVTNLVKDLKASGQNNGFMFTLQNEQSLRHVEFASSDHSDSTLWPELVVTYQLPQGISGVGRTAEPLIVYPNPTNGLVSILLPSYMAGATKLTVIDMTGRTVKEVSVPSTNKETELDVTGIAKGAYLLRADNDEGIASARLIVQ